jgi:hypothetical protein
VIPIGIIPITKIIRIVVSIEAGLLESGAYSAKLLAGTRLRVPDNLTNFLATVIIHSRAP